MKVILVALFCLGLSSSSPAAEEGLPIESALVRDACGACHQPDERNLMSRLSYERKTPEGWQQTVLRMIRLARVQVSSDQARAIVRYLADHHGLAPSEARPFFHEAEKRPALPELPNKDFKDTCTRCHHALSPLAQRRTEEEWKLLKGMHLGYFPLAEIQTFRGRAPWDPQEESGGGEREPEAGPGEEKEERVDRVLNYLSKNYKLASAEWRAFQARKTERDLSGRWLFKTHRPGQGLVAGELRIEKSGEDYLTRAELSLPDGSVDRREGKAVLYAGYSWRGSSKGPGLGELKEVLMLSDDGASLAGRFFSGAFGELGLDVSLVRLGADARVAGALPRALPAPTGSATVRILGANLPADLGSRDIDLGPGVTVKEVHSRGPGAIEVEAEVSKEAPPGLRDISVRAVTATGAFAIYDRVDYVKVRPEEGMARLGGVRFPKQFVQFEAVAFHRGPDGEPLTADDVDLGPVQPRWSLEEYHIRHEDDDLKYVGSIDASGLFTPSVEGPNPARYGTNNFGDVWVVATYAPPGASEASPELRGRAHLLVTVPLYAYWDFPETFP